MPTAWYNYTTRDLNHSMRTAWSMLCALRDPNICYAHYVFYVSYAWSNYSLRIAWSVSFSMRDPNICYAHCVIQLRYAHYVTKIFYAWSYYSMRIAWSVLCALRAITICYTHCMIDPFLRIAFFKTIWLRDPNICAMYDVTDLCEMRDLTIPSMPSQFYVIVYQFYSSNIACSWHILDCGVTWSIFILSYYIM